MSFDDIIDSGFQPSRWNLGWRRFALVRTMHLAKDDPRLQKQYYKYLQTLIMVTGAQLSADSDFLSMDPENRLKRITRLVERALLAENKLRKEVLDAFSRLKGSQNKILSLPAYVVELYTTTTKSYLNSDVKVQMYPELNPSLVENALSTAHRKAIEQIVIELVEPKLKAEIKALRHQNTNQLFLDLSYKH